MKAPQGTLRFAFALLLVATAGCEVLMPSASQAPPKSLSAPPRAPSSADELVAYLARLRDLDDPGLALEAARQREAQRQQPGDMARVKLAMVLSAQQGDEAEILSTVEPLARDPKGIDPDVHAMASFLQHLGVERRRLKESAANAGAKSREDRKAYESQRQRAETLQERNAQLQQKLDALTNLEKSLSGRKGN